MKDFFKFMFASMLGFLLTSIVLFFLFFAFVMALVSLTKPEEVSIKDKTILHLKLDYEIDDRSSTSPLNFNFDFESFRAKPGLNDLLKNISKAKNDTKIAGIYLDLMDAPSGLATLSEIRNALSDFKESGKFIYAYGEILSQKTYYLATVADKIFVNPVGMIEFRGFRGNVVFLKGLLEKLEIEPQIIRHGKYKSAVEPLILDKMSDENKEQTLKFVQSMWDDVIIEISESRKLSIEKLNDIADKLVGSDAESAYNLHLIDSVIYYDQFLKIVGNKIGVENVSNDDLVSLADYKNVILKDQKEKRSKNKIAIIYASGSIIQGEGDEQSIGSDKIARTIRNARLDNSIKAVVLRVNSPGGDGVASDIILREVNLTREVKPVVVSMGNYAASGGYYISCGANKIFANPNTITGSIGVFGIIPNFQKFFNNKLGITFDGIMTNENADFMEVTKPLSEFQFTVIQNEIEKFYSTFLKHVSDGRKMSTEQVDEIAQGRVWSGTDALKLGLIDELGGIDDAVKAASELAKITEYRKVELPEQAEPFEQLIKDITGKSSRIAMEKELGPAAKYINYLKEVSKMQGVQARLPFEIDVD
jgi:protease IV